MHKFVYRYTAWCITSTTAIHYFRCEETFLYLVHSVRYVEHIFTFYINSQYHNKASMLSLNFFFVASAKDWYYTYVYKPKVYYTLLCDLNVEDILLSPSRIFRLIRLHLFHILHETRFKKINYTTESWYISCSRSRLRNCNVFLAGNEIWVL